MPAIARKDSVDSVDSPDGAGLCCGSPSAQSTDTGSANVFINGIGVVRKGDTMIEHSYPGPCCAPHSPACDTFSDNVYANGENIARVGDAYDNHIILSGSPNVFANGE